MKSKENKTWVKYTTPKRRTKGANRTLNTLKKQSSFSTKLSWICWAPELDMQKGDENENQGNTDCFSFSLLLFLLRVSLANSFAMLPKWTQVTDYNGVEHNQILGKGYCHSLSEPNDYYFLQQSLNVVVNLNGYPCFICEIQSKVYP